MEWTGIRSRVTVSVALKQLRNTGAIERLTVPTNYRTRRGFWLKDLFIRVSPRAMQQPALRVPRPAAPQLVIQYTN
jgi:hypothetical protein